MPPIWMQKPIVLNEGVGNVLENAEERSAPAKKKSFEDRIEYGAGCFAFDGHAECRNGRRR